MSENLDIRARLIGSDELSPVLKKFLSNLREVESVTRRFNANMAGLGRVGQQSFDGVGRAAKAVSAQMQGLQNLSRSAARGYSADWGKASSQRLNDARRLYANLERLESSYQRQIERRVAAERRAASGRSYGGVRLPAPNIRTIAAGAAITGAGVVSALRKRMETQAAEVRAQMFGDLSSGEVVKLRKDFADKAGIKYGIGTTKVLDTAIEGLKAGVARQYAAEFADLALKAQAGLDVNPEAVGKLLGRLSTQMPWDTGRFSKILNAVAVANNSTAADGNEIIEAMRRSLSALATTKMTPEQLAALDATQISLGTQSFKSGTFVSFLTSQLAGADSARGQQAKDLGSAANTLGFGSRGAMAKAMRERPMEAIQQILDGLARLPEKLRTKVAKQIGGREWMDELLTLVLGRDKLKDVVRDIESKPGFLDRTALQKIRSMQGRWASISAALGLVWERVGAGLEDWFEKISDSIISLADKFNFDTIREHVAALIDGAREGFGLKDWGEIVKSVADNFDAGTVAKWREFGKGFAEGVREFASGLKTAFSALGILAGKNPADAREMGNLVAQLTGLTVALAALSPVLSVVTTLALGLTGLGQALTFIGSSAAAVGLLSLFAARNQDRGVADEHIRRTDPKTGRRESYKDWQERIEEKKKLRGYKPSGDPLFQPTSFGGATDFSGMRRTSDLSDNLNKFTGKIERAAFVSNGTGGLQYAALGGGSRRGLSGGGYIGGLPAIVRSVPGQALPDFGVGRSGSIISRDKIPSFGDGGAAPRGGSGFTGSSMSVAKKAAMDQLRREGVPEANLNHAASLLVGQAIAESGLNPNLVHDRGTGYGIYGARLGRRDKMLKWLSANGYAKNSLEGQMRYMAHEAMTDKAYAPSRSALMGASDDNMRRATSTLTNNFESPKVDNSPTRYGNSLDALRYKLDGDAGAAGGGVGTGKIVKGVDRRLQEIVNAASTHLPAGYRVEMSSGFRGAGQLNHNGSAADYKIIGPDGKAISNRGEDPTGMYTLLARHSYGEMLARYPNLKGKFAWGGAFGTQLGGGGRRDLMHFDVNGERGRYSQYQLHNMGSVPGTKYGITDNVPSSVIQNVPAAQAPPRLGPGQMRGGSTGPINIHINGTSHDPEALATLVQRRIDESMNWRTHDTASEYT
ncbi:phage tail tape measure protein [Bradyrhizobium sp. 41S5]|uniref:phage tail tape measure protein n=1 Tax=Bradyrhizobium sp. 41S5 TaxID=1404443 RepID=UPI00156BC6E9|nr:phage tail tape measure protein [Bradyrhizobium sp. 41S5]UFX46139.1 phage tail tape measure protein [Bradyrhizobium sp. 41S5]